MTNFCFVVYIINLFIQACIPERKESGSWEGDRWCVCPPWLVNTDERATCIYVVWSGKIKGKMGYSGTESEPTREKLRVKN